MESDTKKWLSTAGETFFRDIGITEGQSVLDFGCGRGNYTIPAAKIVGNGGKVYAVDKKEIALTRVDTKAKVSNLRNIERVLTNGELEIKLGDETMDVVLLYDVLHDRCISDPEDKKELLREIYRVLKPSGFLSVSPEHRKLTEIMKEIEESGFLLANEYNGTVISFGGQLEEGKILNFRKRQQMSSLI